MPVFPPPFPTGIWRRWTPIPETWSRNDTSLKFFFFQAEDGIRDWSVTGVQTCALPISMKVTPKTSGAPTSYTLNADPQSDGSGTNHFYIDSSDSSIHVNATQAASSSDQIGRASCRERV